MRLLALIVLLMALVGCTALGAQPLTPHHTPKPKPTATATLAPTPTPVVTPTPAPTLPTGYTFADEFDTFDTSRWSARPYISGTEASYTTARCSASGGILTMSAIRTPNAGYPWSACLITSDLSFRQLYGVFAARIKLPVGRGLWPAFWLVDSRPDGSGPAEIDTMEVLANPIGTWANGDVTKLYTFIHNTAGSSGQGTATVDLSLDFHVYEVEWRADFVSWRLDGVEVFRYTGGLIPNMAMPVIFDLAVGGSWPGPSDVTTPDPSEMLVDWVRVSP